MYTRIQVPTYWGTSPDWLGCLACKVLSKGSSLPQDGYCVGTLNKSFAYNCFAPQIQIY